MRLERRDWRGPLWGMPWRLRWPVSGGCPRRMFGSALRWGRGWRSQRRAAAWLGARGPLCPSGAGGGGAASAAPRASVSVIPSCRQGCRREANPTQTPCSGDVPTACSGDVPATFQWPLERRQNVAGTGCWNVAGTVENRHSSARAQGALRALRPRGSGGTSTTKNPSPFMGMGHEQSLGVLWFSPSPGQQRVLAPLWAWGTNNHWGFLGFPLPLDNKDSWPLYGHGAQIITGGSWVFPFPWTTKIPSPFMGMDHK